MPPGLDRFCRYVIVGLAFFCTLVAAYAWFITGQVGLALGALVVTCFVLATMRLSPVIRVNLALSGLGVVFALYVAEMWFTFVQNPAATHGFSPRSADFDSRSPLEVVSDLRKAGVDAHASFFGRLTMVDGRNSLSTPSGALLPLGGLSNRLTVFCNESGQYEKYQSDEHGFHNPPGLWSTDRAEIVALGDSFTQGTCVGSDQSFVARIRQVHPSTLNLGMSGSGPLFELATLEEYGPVLKPRTVLWFFFEANDYLDLAEERANPLLMQYLRTDFGQRLIERQPAIDAAWSAEEDRLLSAFNANRRPNLTAAANWFDDVFVVHRNRTAVARVLRLREVRTRVGARLANPTGEESQLPLLAEVLARARARTESWGGRLYFVALPGMEVLIGRSPIREQLYSRAIETARGLGISTVDVRETFRTAAIPSLFYYPDSHYSPTGAKLVAQAVLTAMSPYGVQAQKR